METSRHTETVGDREYVVDGYPAEWASLPLAGKVAWLQGHTAPRCSFADAHRILSAHGQARRAAEAEALRSSYQALAEQSGGALMSLADAGAFRVTFGQTHYGKTLAEISENDRQYLSWMARQGWIRGKLREAVLVMCHETRPTRRAMR